MRFFFFNPLPKLCCVMPKLCYDLDKRMLENGELYM